MKTNKKKYNPIKDQDIFTIHKYYQNINCSYDIQEAAFLIYDHCTCVLKTNDGMNTSLLIIDLKNNKIKLEVCLFKQYSHLLKSKKQNEFLMSSYNNFIEIWNINLLQKVKQVNVRLIEGTLFNNQLFDSPNFIGTAVYIGYKQIRRLNQYQFIKYQLFSYDTLYLFYKNNLKIFQISKGTNRLIKFNYYDDEQYLVTKDNTLICSHCSNLTYLYDLKLQKVIWKKNWIENINDVGLISISESQQYLYVAKLQNLHIFSIYGNRDINYLLEYNVSIHTDVIKISNYGCIMINCDWELEDPDDGFDYSDDNSVVTMQQQKIAFLVVEQIKNEMRSRF